MIASLALFTFHDVYIIVALAPAISIFLPAIVFFADAAFAVEQVGNVEVAHFTFSFLHAASDTVLDIIAWLTFSFCVHSVT